MTTTYRDLGPVDEEELYYSVEDDDAAEGPDEELLDPLDAFDESSKQFIDEIIKRTILFCEELADMQLRPYQRETAYRLIESVIINDGEEITALWCRQSGKSETIAVVLAGCMVLLPILAKSFEILERFKKGFWVGCFAPVDEQSKLIYGKVVDKLTSDHAVEIMMDPEINEKATGKGTLLKLRSGSYVRRQTANPRAKIEGTTYHIIVIDEAQDADDTVVKKSIHPMLASTAGTMVKIGTPTFHKNDFYRSIQQNKRRDTRRRSRRNHFEFSYRTVSKYNPQYGKFITQEKIRLGEDSDEFQMSYNIKWQLDRGMLITEEELDYLADPSMQLVKSWHRTPVVVGIDPARVKDSTVVTVCWVDWDHPDAAGYREHRILNWLEIQNTNWEEQYWTIMDFLDGYNLAYVGVDAQGMGGPVAERLALLLSNRCEVVALSSDAKTQAERWKHLIELIQRRMLVYPGHSKAKRTKAWKRFRQQMEDAERVIKGQYMLVQAPEDERDAHDDYVDALAIACAMSLTETVEQAQAFEAPWFR